MSTAAKAISLQRLKRRALSLGTVKVFDQAINFLLPVVLVRCLDTATFGEYRLLWLAVGTVMAVATLNMGGSLFFFLPRALPFPARTFFVEHLSSSFGIIFESSARTSFVFAMLSKSSVNMIGAKSALCPR